MAIQHEQIRDQQQATWTSFHRLKKWDAPGWPARARRHRASDGARLQPDSYVLDIASAPGSWRSAAARCPQGKVMMTDLAENMLLIAKRPPRVEGPTLRHAR
jgi:cyclopropane fatty-acyl-phospholipid synthase-like methyltransferase